MDSSRTRCRDVRPQGYWGHRAGLQTLRVAGCDLQR